jgi:hypothetical protein
LVKIGAYQTPVGLCSRPLMIQIWIRLYILVIYMTDVYLIYYKTSKVKHT